MKRILITLLMLLMTVGFVHTARADSPNVIMDGTPLSFDVPPAVEQGRTLVPLRAIFEAMGSDIIWDNQTQTVTAAKANTQIRLQIGTRTAYRNGLPVSLDVPAIVINSRTLVPLRFIGEALGAQVMWVGSTNTVIINSKEITALAEGITKGLNSDMEKTKAIHDWICKNITYESYYPYVLQNQPWIHLTYPANVLLKKHSNCLGYSNLNAAVHQAAGIPARVISGWAYNPEKPDSWMNSEDCRHSWNEVFIDGRWIIEDTTMDSTPVGIRYNYFNPDIGTFEKDHRREGVQY